MLQLWQEAEDQKIRPIYRECIPSGSTCQLLYADIQSFLVKSWRKLHTGLMNMKIQGRRSRSFWNLLKRGKNSFGVSSLAQTDGDDLNSLKLHRNLPNMILTQDVLDRYRANQGYVYLAHAVGNTRYKIGMTRDVSRRMSQLNQNQPAYRAEVIRAYWTLDNAIDEKYWHEKYSEFRINGEWFDFGEISPRDFSLMRLAFAASNAPSMQRLTDLIANKFIEKLHDYLKEESDVTYKSVCSEIEFYVSHHMVSLNTWDEVEGWVQYLENSVFQELDCYRYSQEENKLSLREKFIFVRGLIFGYRAGVRI